MYKLNLTMWGCVDLLSIYSNVFPQYKCLNKNMQVKRLQPLIIRFRWKIILHCWHNDFDLPNMLLTNVVYYRRETVLYCSDEWSPDNPLWEQEWITLILETICIHPGSIAPFCELQELIKFQDSGEPFSTIGNVCGVSMIRQECCNAV
jgi:hypothetical protein